MFLYCEDCNMIHAKYNCKRENEYIIAMPIPGEGVVVKETLLNVGLPRYTCPLVYGHKSRIIYYVDNCTEDELIQAGKLFTFHEVFSPSIAQFIELKKLTADQILLVQKVFNINEET